MANLYELTDELAHLQSLIDMAGGEITDEVEDALDALALNKETAAEKLEGYGKVLANFQGEAAALKAEEKRLADKRRVLDNTMSRLKARVSEYMLIAGETKIKAGTFTFAMQKSAPALVIDEETAIPDRFWLPREPNLDRAALKAELKDGNEIAGARLEQSTHLRIR